MLNQIKINGFDRVKQEIEDTINLKKIKESHLESLKNHFKIQKIHLKHNEDRNAELLKDHDRLYFSQEVKLIRQKLFRNMRGISFLSIKK